MYLSKVSYECLPTLVTPTKPTEKPKPPTTTKPFQSKSNGDCAYECYAYYCSVRRGGQNRYCFSPQYGGFCYGTVKGCVGCKSHCKKRG